MISYINFIAPIIIYSLSYSFGIGGGTFIQYCCQVMNITQLGATYATNWLFYLVIIKILPMILDQFSILQIIFYIAGFAVVYQIIIEYFIVDSELVINDMKKDVTDF